MTSTDSSQVVPSAATGWLPAQVGELMPIVTGLGAGIALCAATELGIPDAIDDTPALYTDVAATVGANPDLVRRLLRALAAHGFFTPVGTDRFAHSRLSALLRSDSPSGGAAFLQNVRDNWMSKTWQHLPHAVRSGRTAMSELYGKELFEYFAEVAPSEGAAFNESMTRLVGSMNDALADSLDLSDAKHLVDVGGGHGTMLSTMLERNPGLHGTLFDLEYTVAGAVDRLRSGDLADRSTIVAGNVMDGVPADADVYTLRTVLHMWDDETCVRILNNCARAARPGARIVVLDQIIDPEQPSPMATLMDLQMFLIAGGRERSVEDFRELFAKANLTFSGVTETPVLLQIVEATVPAA